MDPTVLYAKWTQLVNLLDVGASVYDEEVNSLMDSIELGFQLLLRTEGTDT